jgi:hypothetical protein
MEDEWRKERRKGKKEQLERHDGTEWEYLEWMEDRVQDKREISEGIRGDSCLLIRM